MSDYYSGCITLKGKLVNHTNSIKDPEIPLSESVVTPRTLFALLSKRILTVSLCSIVDWFQESKKILCPSLEHLTIRCSEG